MNKPGYLPQTVDVRTKIDNVGAQEFMEDAAVGGLGMGVDLATGAALEHVPDPVTVKLQPTAAHG